MTVLLTFGFAFAWLEIIFDQESFRLFQIPKSIAKSFDGRHMGAYVVYLLPHRNLCASSYV